jgi:hypothetical protein
MPNSLGNVYVPVYNSCSRVLPSTKCKPAYNHPSIAYSILPILNAAIDKLSLYDEETTLDTPK